MRAGVHAHRMDVSLGVTPVHLRPEGLEIWVVQGLALEVAGKADTGELQVVQAVGQLFDGRIDIGQRHPAERPEAAVGGDLGLVVLVVDEAGGLDGLGLVGDLGVEPHRAQDLAVHLVLVQRRQARGDVHRLAHAAHRQSEISQQIDIVGREIVGVYIDPHGASSGRAGRGPSAAGFPPCTVLVRTVWRRPIHSGYGRIRPADELQRRRVPTQLVAQPDQAGLVGAIGLPARRELDRGEVQRHRQHPQR